MGLALPTWWVIQLVCRISFETSSSSFDIPAAPEPLHQLDCLYKANNKTISDYGAENATATNNNAIAIEHDDDQQHRLYYRCVFQEKEMQTENQIADCRSTNPPLPLYTNDSESFDLEQEFPRRVSLQVENLTTDSPTTTTTTTTTTLFVAPSGSSAIWLTLPKFPYFNESSFHSVHLKCNRSRDADGHILCVLRTNDGRADDEYPYIFDDGIDHPPTRRWTYLLAVVAIAGGGLGNILVCLAVCLDRGLQNVTNYFLLSLAVADLLVCLFVMPLGAIQGFFGYWPLGMDWCNVYVSCDVLACSCSIWHMCCISLTRYLGIQNPLKTRQSYSTKRFVGIKIAIVWALSLLVSGWVTFLGLHNSINIMPEPDHCVINNQTFAGFGSLIAFYLPMIIMIITYSRTTQLLRKKARFLEQKPGSEHEGQTFRRLGGRFRKPPPVREKATTPISPEDPNKKSSSQPKVSRTWRTTVIPRTTNKNPAPNVNSSQPTTLLGTTTATGNVTTTNGTRRVMDSATENNSVTHTTSSQNDLENAGAGGKSARSRTLRLPLTAPSTIRFLATRTKRQNMAAAANVVRTEQKASKVLGIVFLAFVCCWTPFFLLNVFFIFCPQSDCNAIPDYCIDLALWLGYISSTINPIIYTIANRTFRAAFSRLLKCKCTRFSRPPRYHSVNENRNSTLLAQTPSSAAAGAATVPLSLSLQGTPLMTPSSASSYLNYNIRSPVLESQSESYDLAESSTTT